MSTDNDNGKAIDDKFQPDVQPFPSCTRLVTYSCHRLHTSRRPTHVVPFTSPKSTQTMSKPLLKLIINNQVAQPSITFYAFSMAQPRH